jgi:DNA-binding transcriptional ArsR family regulator
LTKDAIFSILSNQRRRCVLYYLHDNRGSVSLRELAERIAAWENGVPVDELEYKQRKRVYTSLHQTHLPKLDEADIVAYDRDSGRIELASRAADLDDYLSVAGERDDRWYRYYLVLSVGGTACAVAAWLDLPPFAAVSDLSVAGVVVVLFAVTATVHASVGYRRRSGGPAGADDLPAEESAD